MKVSKYLDSLLDDLIDFEPFSLTDIVRFVKNHQSFSSILMLTCNSSKASRYLLTQSRALLKDGSRISDIQLAGLVVIMSEIDSEMYRDLVSSASERTSKYHWSKGMATSYLLHKEVTSETIRQSA